MAVQCINYSSGKGTFEVSIDLNGMSMLESEVKIQETINELGNMVTEKKLAEFDADGEPLSIAGTKLTTKGKYNGNYETPYGQVSISRHIYQSNHGGTTYCPLNENARIVKKTCTLKFAKTISNKYAYLASPELVLDMEENHSRKLSRSFVQDISEFVGLVVDAKEELWDYEVPEMEDSIATVSVSMDGANVLMLKEGYREAMTGAISLYNKAGNRMHSMYIALGPEYGKESFFKRMESAIANIKQMYPTALYIGISDGAKDLWSFLKKHTAEQILDYYHASEYLSGASYAIFPKNEINRKDWLDKACSRLKHDSGYIPIVLDKMSAINNNRLSAANKDKLKAAITYFTNNQTRMDYPQNVDRDLPIGSGVIEAACKTIVKSRLCRTGMKWKGRGIRVVLSLRAMVKTRGKWDSFWNKINKSGVPNLV